jgi:hypothetical protein
MGMDELHLTVVGVIKDIECRDAGSAHADGRGGCEAGPSRVEVRECRRQG